MNNPFTKNSSNSFVNTSNTNPNNNPLKVNGVNPFLTGTQINSNSGNPMNNNSFSRVTGNVSTVKPLINNPFGNPSSNQNNNSINTNNNNNQPSISNYFPTVGTNSSNSNTNNSINKNYTYTNTSGSNNGLLNNQPFPNKDQVNNNNFPSYNSTNTRSSYNTGYSTGVNNNISSGYNSSYNNGKNLSINSGMDQFFPPPLQNSNSNNYGFDSLRSKIQYLGNDPNNLTAALFHRIPELMDEDSQKTVKSHSIVALPEYLGFSPEELRYLNRIKKDKKSFDINSEYVKFTRESKINVAKKKEDKYVSACLTYSDKGKLADWHDKLRTKNEDPTFDCFKQNNYSMNTNSNNNMINNGNNNSNIIKAFGTSSTSNNSGNAFFKPNNNLNPSNNSYLNGLGVLSGTKSATNINGGNYNNVSSFNTNSNIGNPFAGQNNIINSSNSNNQFNNPSNSLLKFNSNFSSTNNFMGTSGSNSMGTGIQNTNNNIFNTSKPLQFNTNSSYNPISFNTNPTQLTSSLNNNNNNNNNMLTGNFNNMSNTSNNIYGGTLPNLYGNLNNNNFQLPQNNFLAMDSTKDRNILLDKSYATFSKHEDIIDFVNNGEREDLKKRIFDNYASSNISNDNYKPNKSFIVNVNGYKSNLNLETNMNLEIIKEFKSSNKNANNNNNNFYFNATKVKTSQYEENHNFVQKLISQNNNNGNNQENSRISQGSSRNGDYNNRREPLRTVNSPNNYENTKKQKLDLGGGDFNDRHQIMIKNYEIKQNTNNPFMAPVINSENDNYKKNFHTLQKYTNEYNDNFDDKKVLPPTSNNNYSLKIVFDTPKYITHSWNSSNVLFIGKLKHFLIQYLRSIREFEEIDFKPTDIVLNINEELLTGNSGVFDLDSIQISDEQYGQPTPISVLSSNFNKDLNRGPSREIIIKATFTSIKKIKTNPNYIANTQNIHENNSSINISNVVRESPTYSHIQIRTNTSYFPIMSKNLKLTPDYHLLQNMTETELKNIPNFRIENEFGFIYWEDPVDLTFVNLDSVCLNNGNFSILKTDGVTYEKLHKRAKLRLFQIINRKIEKNEQDYSNFIDYLHEYCKKLDVNYY